MLTKQIAQFFAILFAFLATSIIFMSGKAYAATILVDSTTDAAATDAACGLREAILNANADADTTGGDCVAGSGPDTVDFSALGAGLNTFAPATPLPLVTDTILIDGITHAGSSCGTLIPSLPAASNTPHVLTIEIDASGSGLSDGIGLSTGSDGSTVRGLVINGALTSGFDGSGVATTDSTGHLIECNYLGTNVAGTAADGNEFGGVSLGFDTTLTTITNNLLSGNAGGVGVFGSGTTDNTIEGNIVGLNASGTGAVPNTEGGIIAGVSSSATTVRGNLVSGNAVYGIHFATFFGSSDGNFAYGNFVGTDITGTVDRGNGGPGVFLESNDNLVGSPLAADRNLISGNNANGVLIDGDGNSVANNYIGVDTTGSVSLQNTPDGLRSTSTGINTVGGPTSAYRNIISGNDDDGLQLDSGAPSSTLTIQNNYIGISSDGLTPVENDQRGIEIGFGDLGDNSIIDNVISGNGEHGVAQFAGSSTGDLYEGNLVGTDTSGNVAAGFGNVGIGILIRSNGPHTIGGTGAGDGNVIAGNGAGVVVDDFGGFFLPASVTIIGNSIHSNDGYVDTGLGIDLTSVEDPSYGPTLNDAGDPDTGGNEYLNFIEATSAFTMGTTQTVNFDLDVPAGDYRIEFFANDTADPSGYGEGQTFLAARTITHGGSGVESFTETFTNPDDSRVLSATVTEDLGGSTFGVTSEFSNIFQANFEGATDSNNPPEDDGELADTGVNVITQVLIGFAIICTSLVITFLSRKKVYKIPVNFE